MKTLATMVTERGQVSIPAEIRRKLSLTSGQRVLWEAVSEHECRILVSAAPKVVGALAMLGYAAKFRKPRRTQEWMHEIRAGELAGGQQ